VVSPQAVIRNCHFSFGGREKTRPTPRRDPYEKMALQKCTRRRREKADTFHLPFRGAYICRERAKQFQFEVTVTLKFVLALAEPCVAFTV